MTEIVVDITRVIRLVYHICFILEILYRLCVFIFLWFYRSFNSWMALRLVLYRSSLAMLKAWISSNCSLVISFFSYESNSKWRNEFVERFVPLSSGLNSMLEIKSEKAILRQCERDSPASNCYFNKSFASFS